MPVKARVAKDHGNLWTDRLGEDEVESVIQMGILPTTSAELLGMQQKKLKADSWREMALAASAEELLESALNSSSGDDDDEPAIAMADGI
jgi:hypothetical protein